MLADAQRTDGEAMTVQRSARRIAWQPNRVDATAVLRIIRAQRLVLQLLGLTYETSYSRTFQEATAEDREGQEAACS